MPWYIYEKPSKPHWSELWYKWYTEQELKPMLEKWERVSKLAKKLMKKLKYE
jgi:hypothetical protein